MPIGDTSATEYRFPFGLPLLNLAQKPLQNARVFVLGVYASAVHARWLNPDGSTRVAALAVASEPHIFWRGEDAADIITSIPVPEEAGRLVCPGRRSNGPSGAALDCLYLNPLGLTRQDAWLCDLLPESRMNDGQAKAVRRHYQPIAETLGLPHASVPGVPKQFASADRVREILDEFLSSGAETLITLGDVPLKEFVAPLRLVENPSINAFGTSPAQYGRRHTFSVGGRRFDLLPLVHPRQAARLGAHSPDLALAHDRWLERVRATKN
jgi:hypothetical protein